MSHTWMHTYECTHEHNHTRTHTHTHTHTHRHTTNTHPHTHAHTRTRTSAYTHTRTQAQTHTRIMKIRIKRKLNYTSGFDTCVHLQDPNISCPGGTVLTCLILLLLLQPVLFIQIMEPKPDNWQALERARGEPWKMQTLFSQSVSQFS